MEYYKSNCGKCGASYRWTGRKSGIGATSAELTAMQDAQTICRECKSPGLDTKLDHDSPSAVALDGALGGLARAIVAGAASAPKQADSGFVIERAADKLFWAGVDFRSDRVSTCRWVSAASEACRFMSLDDAEMVELDEETEVVTYAVATERPKSIGRVVYEATKSPIRWDDLEPEGQKVWEAGAQAAVDHWLANDGREFKR